MACLHLLSLLVALCPAAAEFQLTIIHNNDVHSHFDPVAASTGACRDFNDPDNPCYGGIGRLVSAVSSIKQQVPNTLALYGGDIFQGDLYYTLFKSQVVLEMINMVSYDAMALGNHEFDDGLDGLLPYLEGVNHQQLCTNIDFGALASSVTDQCANSVVRELDGRKIGIMGYTTTETRSTSNAPREVLFTDEVAALRAEASRLRGQGVDIILAVGHSGLKREMEMAELLEDVDIIVGGHSHSLLYTGDAPHEDPTEGPYPVVVRQDSGRTVLVVQAYQYGKYLGRLDVTFDDGGEVTDWGGNPILLDGEQDETAEAALEQYREQLVVLRNQEIGSTLVQLVGDRSVCRAEECNLGNLIADATLRALLTPAEGQWSQVSAAIMNGGGIRESVAPGSVRLSDVLQIQPFGNTINVVTLRGATLRDVFEHSVSAVEEGAGRFLQVAGIRVTYDLECPVGSRVRRLEITCTFCLVPRLELVQDDAEYRIAMPNFLSQGGDGYDVIRDNKIAELNADLLDVDLLRDHIERLSPVITGIEGRIIITEDNGICGNDDPRPHHGYPEHLSGTLGHLGHLGHGTHSYPGYVPPHLHGFSGGSRTPLPPHLIGYHIYHRRRHHRFL